MMTLYEYNAHVLNHLTTLLPVGNVGELSKVIAAKVQAGLRAGVLQGGSDLCFDLNKEFDRKVTECTDMATEANVRVISSSFMFL